MSSVKISTNSEWLVWARKTAYYDVESIAKKINKTPETIKKWEESGKIEYDNLVELAKYYQRPTSVFFSKSKPNYEKEDIRDFRTFDNKNNVVITPEIEFELRNARFRRKILLNLENEYDNFEISDFLFKDFNSENIENLAQKIRSIIGMKPARFGYSLNYWIGKLESNGILVFEFYGLDPDEIRGYALYNDKLPIIGINHREYKNPQKFTLFHELAHILLKQNSISNILDYDLRFDVETICNQIAAEILVPSQMFKKKVPEREDNLKSNDINFLANFFNVSKDLIIRKGIDLGFITNNIYKKRNAEFKFYLHERKPNKTKNKEKTIEKISNWEMNKEDETKKLSSDEKYQKQASEILRKNSNYFIKKIFEAYNNDLISDLELARDLNTSLYVIDKIKENISKEESL